jgi:23S rRNA pseudouridine1911/1915/1917 synthase
MGYEFKKYYIPKRIKAFLFLIRELNLTQKESQRFLDNRRVIVNRKIVDKTEFLEEGYVDVLEFIPNPKGLKPIFETDDFAVYDKLSGVLVHPSRMDSDYSMLDEIKASFGNIANIVHRIDKETSGLLLVSKNKTAERDLKIMFQNKQIKKEYTALVEGKLEQNLTINRGLALNKDANSKEKIVVSNSGKESITFIEKVKEFDNYSFIKAIPITGRQHQIRVHLNSINHRILGEPIYGVNFDIASKYLSQELNSNQRVKYTKAKRLMLNSSYLEFEYRGELYKIESKIDLISELK